MPPKSERFELRLEQETLDKVDAWRRDQADMPSRAEAVRRLVEAGLGAGTEPQRVNTSNAERLITYLLCDLHEKMAGQDSELDSGLIRRALMDGHTWALEMKYGHLFPTKGDNHEIKAEVVDILDMFNLVESAVERLSDEDREKLKGAIGYLDLARFDGFDGNHETEHSSVMSFLVRDLQRFPRFKDRVDLDPHTERLTRYRRMVRAFHAVVPRLTGRRVELAELIEIIEARRSRPAVGAAND